MKKIVILAALALAAWQASRHWADLFERKPSHLAQIVNQCREAIESVRLEVGGRVFVKEQIAPGTTATFRFQVNRDAAFDLSWKRGVNESHWTGGFVAAGPMVQRHVITVHEDGTVVYTVSRAPAP
jgi:hypothetical protein